MGKIKANPDGTVKANVVITGFIEKSIVSPIVIGIKSATTAVLLIASVKKIATSDIIIIKTNGDWIEPETVISTSQWVAPVFPRAEPRHIAPPYISIRPQFTSSSTSFHLNSLKTKAITTAANAILAKPNLSPKQIHENIVPIIRIPIDHSSRFIFPMHAVLLIKSIRALFTSFISAGKSIISNKYVTASNDITVGKAARAHLIKSIDSPVASRSIPTAKGALAPPRNVATPPITHPHAIPKNRALP